MTLQQATIEEQDHRPSGIPVLGGMPWGTHFCHFYQTKAHLAEVLVPYFRAGLENNELCVWVTSEALTAEEARAELAAAVPDLPEREARGQFEVFPYTDWYLAGGTFDMNRVLEGWQQKYRSCIGRGYEGLRVSGNTAWLEKDDWLSFSEYEQSIDGAIEGSRMLVLCTYSLDRCGPYELLDVVRNHQFALVLGHRGWERLENAEARRARELQLASDARYRELFSAMSEGFAVHEIICDAAGKPVDYRFLDVNPAFERQTGLARADTVGRTLSQVLPGAEPEWVERYGRVALTGEPTHFRLHAGPLGRWFEVFAYRPSPGRFAAMFLDVTEAQRAQERLRETADELARSNRELEQFASVASHDLQEPLRAVSGYLSLLEAQYEHRLDDRGRRFIAGAVQGAGRMNALITDLLSLSRLGTHGVQPGPADLNEVLGRALAALEASIRESGAHVDSDPLPTLEVDASQIEQLFQNLIGNAIKFSGGKPPRVRVTAVAGDGCWTFGVRDNGIGIDPRHRGRIFEIFQRLHTREQYPGTGIGLAVCKKVVERHGGTIWVESEPGAGSTFFFTLRARRTG
jgi:PAS domain S-box-containing protein